MNTTEIPDRTDPDSAGSGPLGLSALLDSPRLRRRRFDTLPLRGPGAATTDIQGRAPGDSTTPAELSDLISSIATVGVLQPILAEELTQEGQAPRVQLVTGERRLLACRWGAANLPQNPHFESLPAIICPGPLSPEERRIWQIVENLAREPLRPGEQAAALLLHRCAVLSGKLLRAGHSISTEVYGIEDPVARWEALERIRGSAVDCAAPWAEVLHRLGLQLSPRKAREIVSAFRALPRHVSEEMDEAKIRLHTRIRYARLRAGREQAADAIWAAVRARKDTSLLPAALQAGLDDPDLGPEDALTRAASLHEAANRGRADKLSRNHDLPLDDLRNGEAAPVPGTTEEPDSASPPAGRGEAAFAAPGAPAASAIGGDAAVQALRSLISQIRSGHALDRYSRGSLRLLARELLSLLDEEVGD